MKWELGVLGTSAQLTIQQQLRIVPTGLFSLFPDFTTAYQPRTFWYSFVSEVTQNTCMSASTYGSSITFFGLNST